MLLQPHTVLDGHATSTRRGPTMPPTPSKYAMPPTYTDLFSKKLSSGIWMRPALVTFFQTLMTDLQSRGQSYCRMSYVELISGGCLRDVTKR